MSEGFAAPVRYRAEVVGGSVADVVRSAGGWIFDRVMGGWAVNVSVPSCLDARPLRILGATIEGPPLRDLNHAALQVFLGPDDLVGTGVVEHRLSPAARVFKAHALVAAKLPARADRHEYLWVTGLSPSGDADAEIIDTQPVKASSSS